MSLLFFSLQCLQILSLIFLICFHAYHHKDQHCLKMMVVGGWGPEPRMAPPPPKGVERERGRGRCRDGYTDRERKRERSYPFISSPLMGLNSTSYMLTMRCKRVYNHPPFTHTHTLHSYIPRPRHTYTCNSNILAHTHELSYTQS